MFVKIKRVNQNAILPQYAHEHDAGMDLFSTDSSIIKPGEIKLIHTGIAIELTNDVEAQIRPRSGLALTNGITVLNSPGTIDAGYRGEIGIILINHGKENFEIAVGTKIAQMVLTPIIHATIQEVLELEQSERGRGGFGSTGISQVSL